MAALKQQQQPNSCLEAGVPPSGQTELLGEGQLFSHFVFLQGPSRPQEVCFQVFGVAS